MAEQFEPSFATAIEKWERPGGPGDGRAWIIETQDHGYFWGISLQRYKSQVLRWYGPFPDYLQALNDLQAAKLKKGWPHDFAKH